jgi:hypothetical protein
VAHADMHTTRAADGESGNQSKSQARLVSKPG